ncbi:MAG TPA: transposase [Candidatus Binataceae bacterium]|nr:transposase [Candidatus Binataceae bacterium]
MIEAAPSYRRLRQEAAAIEPGEPRASTEQPTRELELPEPDGALQPLKNGILRPAYKPSVLASGVLTVGQRVECTSERAALWPMLAQHERALGGALGALLLDAGYMGIELLSRLAEREINVLCPSGKTSDADWRRRTGGPYFDKRKFIYEAQHDRYRCPAGRELHFDYRARDRRGARYVRYRGAQCSDCELRAQCTKAPRGRTLRRYAGEEIKEAMQQVLRQPRARREYRRRQVLLEPVFARLRGLQHLDRFLRRGLMAVRAGFALHCIAYNLRVAAHLALSRTILIIFSASPVGPPQPLAAIWLTALSSMP